MKVLKAIYNYFKPFVLLLMGRKRILNIKKSGDATIVLSRLMNKGIIPPNEVAKRLSMQSEKDMYRTVRKANKKGKKVTVKELIKPIEENAEFAKLCNDVGLTMNFFKGLAENAIKAKGVLK